MNLEAHELWLAKQRAKLPIPAKAKDVKRCSRIGFAAKRAFEHNLDASVPARGQRVLTPRDRSRKSATSLFTSLVSAPGKAVAARTAVRTAQGFNDRPGAAQGKFGQRPGAGGIIA